MTTLTAATRIANDLCTGRCGRWPRRPLPPRFAYCSNAAPIGHKILVIDVGYSADASIRTDAVAAGACIYGLTYLLSAPSFTNAEAPWMGALF